MTMTPIPEDHWKKLPLTMRQRWWTGTDYGRNAPSPELAAEMQNEIAKLDAAAALRDSVKPSP